MGIFTAKDQKTLEATEKLNEERKLNVQNCQKEMTEILNKYNCDLRIKQEIVILPK